jgi:putative Mn2+ efflux pump MntP
LPRQKQVVLLNQVQVVPASQVHINLQLPIIIENLIKENNMWNLMMGLILILIGIKFLYDAFTEEKNIYSKVREVSGGIIFIIIGIALIFNKFEI